MPLLTPRDFTRETQNRAASSIAYFSISRIFADVGKSYRRKQMTMTKIEQLKNNLYTWVRELPQELRLFHPQIDHGPNSYNFESRQIHVIYFVVLILLLRPSTSSSSTSAGSLLAASFVAALYEEFLIRGEIDHLGPAVHKFYLMTAGITLLSVRRNPLLASEVSKDFRVIIKALKQFSERYPSAMGTIRTLEQLEASQVQSPESSQYLLQLQPEARALFREFGPELCRLWHLLEVSPSTHDQLTDPDRRVATQRMDHPLGSSNMASTMPLAFQSNQGGTADGFVCSGEIYDPTIATVADDLDFFGPYSWSELPNATAWVLKDTPFDIGGDHTLS